MLPVDEEARTLARSYQSAAEEFGDFPCIVTHSGHLSHRDYWRISLAFAEKISALGVPRGALIALNTAEIGRAHV